MNIFKHGPGATKETIRIDRITKSLRWTVLDDFSCADVQMGMSIDLREVVLCAVNQNPTYIPDMSSVSHRMIPGTFFNHLDDDMDLRLMFLQHMQAMNWRIPVKIKFLRLHKDCFNLLSAQVMFDYQDDLLYSMFPMILTRLLPQSDMLFEIGDVLLDIDYYFYGNIWLVPNRH